eukprot:5587223-Prymnesium_polylepis.1
MEIGNGTVALVGSAVVDSRAAMRGGAVEILAGSLTIAEDSVIFGCSAGSYGGAIMLRGGDVT